MHCQYAVCFSKHVNCYRSAFPINGFMIINRLGLNDLIEPINKKLEFQLQDPFLLYRTSKGEIYIQSVIITFKILSLNVCRKFTVMYVIMWACVG